MPGELERLIQSLLTPKQQSALQQVLKFASITDQLSKLLGNLDYAGTVLLDGPVGYWRLDDLSGTTALDDSGFGINGTYVGGVTLKQGGALLGGSDFAALFDGSTGRVDLPANASLNITGSITLEGWIKTPAAGVQAIVGGFQNGGGFAGYGLFINVTAGTIRYSIGTANYESNAAVVNDGAWHHVASSFNGANVSFYLDGVAKGSVAASAPASFLGVRSLGSLAGGGGSYANGTLDEIAIYNTALSAARILTHYNVGKGTRSDPEVTTNLAGGVTATWDNPVSRWGECVWG